MATDELIVVFFAGGFILFVLLLSLADRLRNIRKLTSKLWKTSKK
jgi:hypothetical protein